MTPDSQPGLRRSLKLWHLVVYGIVIIQPTAPMGIYGVVSNVAGGHVVTTILIGMVAMLVTAFSYGRMARIYPSAGSAYTYVGRELNPLLGYVVGWSMLMDYLLNPIICAIWCSAAAQNVLPSVPYAAWAVSFVVLFTVLNLRGVKTSGRMNALLALGMSIVVVVFLAEAIRYIAQVVHPLAGQWLHALLRSSHLFTIARIPRNLDRRAHLHRLRWHLHHVGRSRESPPQHSACHGGHLPCHRDTLGLRGLRGAVSLAAHIRHFLSRWSTPLMYSSPGAWAAAFLFHLLNGTLLIANLGSGMAAQFGAARLLYGMGRANALPSRIFGSVDARTGIPRNNVLIVGACTLVGVFLLTYQSGAELLNFGAFIAFMGVNAGGVGSLQIPLQRKGFSTCRHALDGSCSERIHLAQSQSQGAVVGHRLDTHWISALLRHEASRRGSSQAPGDRRSHSKAFERSLYTAIDLMPKIKRRLQQENAMSEEMKQATGRRTFVKQTGGAMLAAGMTAKSYARVLGANDRIRLGQLGCGQRSHGHVHMVQLAAKQMPVETVAVCDLWSLAREQRAAQVKRAFNLEPQILQVFRRDAGPRRHRRRDDCYRRFSACQVVRRGRESGKRLLRGEAFCQRARRGQRDARPRQAIQADRADGHATSQPALSSRGAGYHSLRSNRRHRSY